RIILGLSLLTHGSHLLMMAINGLKHGAAPLVQEGITRYTDPVPQALILTSIVINFALTALVLVLAYRTYVVLRTDDLSRLKGREYEYAGDRPRRHPAVLGASPGVPPGPRAASAIDRRERLPGPAARFDPADPRRPAGR